MNFNLEKIEHTVTMSLLDTDITHEIIENRVKKFSEIMNVELSENEIKLIIKSIESKNQIKMNLGFTLVDSTHRPWLSNQKENISWYYWNRYKQHLINNDFGKTIVTRMDIITDEIIDLMQNPLDDGQWHRKGLVMGHVQSGKTANYLGVICKALDSGYKIVIVMAGLLNSLRKQTQIRTDFGVIGLDSSLMLQDISPQEKLIGVGVFSHQVQKCPVSITTAQYDFNKSSATQRQTALSQYAPPLVFVIKKNVKIIGNLIDWLKTNNSDLSEHPMLLIDDEADHASINTKKDDLDPAKTNKKIRNLIALFPKNVYLGYTATPFANIFINPDTPEEMVDDLFPENFIKCLDAPNNYFGAENVFIENQLNPVREINDNEDFLRLSHKIDEYPDFIPESLKEAIRVFVLVCTIRILRGQNAKHNSMLVNISRFTGIQSRVRLLIHDYLSQLKSSISNYYALEIDKAIEDSDLLELFNTFTKEFNFIEFDWIDIQHYLHKAISRIEVIEVNSSPQAEKEIDYSKRNYPEGRHIIAIGGLSLSRGITLEGLSTTYFLRNSIMYDTLMQMGRWFGYRTGYEDLCRIFMTDKAKGWYKHIAEATNELRLEFQKMNDLNKTPKDFGLCVRNHEESLIVTARNKMRSAKTIIREIELTGRLIETSRLFTNLKIVNHNLELASNFHKQLNGKYPRKKLGSTDHHYWENVHYEFVRDFVEVFQNHPESTLTDSRSVKKYVEDLANEEGIKNWNVVFISVSKQDNDVDINIVQEELKGINAGIRNKVNDCTKGIMLSHRKLGSGGLDKIDLKENEVRETPLLMIHLLDCRYEQQEKCKTPIFPNGVVAYGISFPGEKNGRRIKKLATYQVNTTWMKQQYGNENESEEDIWSDLYE